MQHKNKKIGIWGYGITGKAAVNYYHQQGYELAVIDKKELNSLDALALTNKNISYFSEDKLAEFLLSHDLIFPSPGIDLRHYPQHESKWLNELDVFFDAWQKPIVAITGSIGKTTVTHLLSKLLANAGSKIAMGGNIGIPMFDLLDQKDSSELAVLELSSFQLEQTKSFAPDLALWTNLHPNHLDRHGSEEEYFKAKAHMLAFQTEKQHALIPFEFRAKVQAQSTIHYFSMQKPPIEHLQTLPSKACSYYIENSKIMRYSNGSHEILVECTSLPPVTFQDNWLMLVAALDLLHIPQPNYAALEFTLPEHRMEKVATINGVDFINDSKATTAQSTLAAVERLQHRPILLLIGGKGKGVDREPMVRDLKGKIKKAFCFGGEAFELHDFCIKNGIPSCMFANLDDAFNAITAQMKAGDQVLLSPAGTSYDLYKIFSERGDHFKRLVSALEKPK